MKRIVWLGALSLAAVSAVAAGCGSSDSGSDSTTAAAESGPITVGFATAKSGFLAAFDVPAVAAAKVKIAEINASGGLDGRKIKFVESDTKSDLAQGVTAAAEVLDKGANFVMTTCDFDFGAPIALAAQKKNVVAMSSCAGSTKFGPSGIGPLAFTMAPAATSEGATMAEYTNEKLGYKTAYVLLDNTIDFDIQSAYGFTQRFKQLGGTVVGQDTFKQDDQSIASQVTRIKGLATKPDVIYVASYMPGSASAMKQLRNGGVDIPIAGDSTMDGDFWKDAVPNISNVWTMAYASVFGDDPSPEVKRVITAFTKATGKAPDYAAGFTTGYSVIEALQRAYAKSKSTDGPKLQKALETFNNEKLLVGATTFTPKYHITFKREFRILKIQDGKTSFVETWTPKVVPIPKG